MSHIQLSNPETPDITVHKSSASSVLPKKNPAAQGKDLDAPVADTPTLQVPTPGAFPRDLLRLAL